MNFAATFLDSAARQVEEWASGWLGQIFGPRVNAAAIGNVTWADLAILGIGALAILLIHSITAFFFHRKKHGPAAKPEARTWRYHVLTALGKPVYLGIWICGIYIATAPLMAKHLGGDAGKPIRQGLEKLFDLAIFVALFWGFFRLTRVLEAKLLEWAKKTESKIDGVIVPLVGRVLRVIVPVMGIFFALPVLGLPQKYAGLIARGSSILIILAIAWTVSQAVHLGEKVVLAEYDMTVADNLRARRLYTQIHLLSKAVYVLIAIFTAASILMLFDEVRRVGASLLASAGVVGVIAGFAAQRTIANLFAGFQLAMTQPIRLDDMVFLENEFGRVEEITLTYVVLVLWDERRLVVPLSYFIEKPFQNWTRASSSLLGSVIVTLDASLSVRELRAATKQIVEGSALWDRRSWNLQVIDLNNNMMQLRVLASANDSEKSWNLRCEIREKLIDLIQTKREQLQSGKTP